MEIKLLEGTPDPEESVCESARNDYRADGVIGYSFEDLMGEIEPDEEHLPDYDNEGELMSKKQLLEAKKRTLIDHLMDSDHWGPFEHPQAKVAIQGITRVVSHQLVRHRHFSYDQQSLRYVEIGDVDDVEDQFQIPKGVDEGGFRHREGYQELDDPEKTRDYYLNAYEHAISYYKRLIGQGVPQQEARKVLPMGIKTNVVMSGNARAWMHILQVRTRADVQGETKRAADAILDELEDWMPYTFGKYRDMLESGYFKHLAP